MSARVHSPVVKPPPQSPALPLILLWEGEHSLPGMILEILDWRFSSSL